MVSSALNRLAPIDFTRYIDRLTERFTGREWLFEQIDGWLQQGNEQFYLLTGEPGVGKSAIAAKLTQIRSDIAAYHFCRAGDVETVRPGRVLRSLAAQLGKTLPHYGEALAKTIDPIHLRIDVNINIESLSNSQVTGIYIENLKESDPRDELEILLRAPLAALPDLYAEHNEPLPTLKVLLIDSLDEAVTTTGRDNMATLLAALSQVDGLPSWIRFILTARPDLRVLQQFELMKLYKLEELLAQNLEDIERYVGDRVEELVVQPESEFQARLEQAQLSAETLVREVKELSKGNFLYTRLLMDGIGTGELSVKNLSILPKTLNEVYQRFLRHRCPFRKWSDRYQPILGTLTVTQEPITKEQLAKFTGIDSKQLESDLGKLQQFLDINHEQNSTLYSIFHQSLREYLLNRKHNQDFWCDRKEQHDIIIDCFEKESKSWRDLRAINSYGLHYLARHLVLSARTEELHKLLNFEREGHNAWFDAKDRVGDTAGFLADVRLAWDQADAAEPSPEGVRHQCCYALIAASLNTLAQKISPELLVAAVANNLFAPAKGLAYVGQVLNSGQGIQFLAKLAPYLSESLLQDAVVIAETAEAPSHRAELLLTLLPYLPSPLKEKSKQITVETIKEINSKVQKVKCWTTLLPHLLDSEKNEILREAVQLSQTAEYSSVELLVNLFPYLPETERQEVILKAVKLAWESSIDFTRLQELMMLSPWIAKLSRIDLLEEILVSVRSFNDESWRAAWLASLSRFLPQRLQQQVIAEVTANLQIISTQSWQERKATSRWGKHIYWYKLPEGTASEVLIGQSPEKAMANIAALLVEAGFFDEPLTLVKSMWLDTGKASVLAGILPDLPERYLKKALKIAEAIKSDSERLQAIAVVALHLPEPLRSQKFRQILESITKLKTNEYYHSTVLSTIALYLPKPLLEKALIIAQEFEDQNSQSYTLANLLPYLPKASLVERGLKIAQTVSRDWIKEKALVETAPYLCSSQLQQALKIARSIGSSSNRASALIALATRLPEPLKGKVMREVAKLPLTAYDRHQRLPALARHLAEPLRTKILKKELNTVQDYIILAPHLPQTFLEESVRTVKEIKNPVEKSQILNALIPYLPEYLKREMLSDALNTARSLDMNEARRVYALIDIVPHLPEVQKPQILEEILSAIQEVQALDLALRKEIPYISESLKSKTLETAHSLLQESYYPFEATMIHIKSMLPDLPEIQRNEVLAKVIEAAKRLPVAKTFLVSALTTMMPLVSESMKSEVIAKTLSILEEIQDTNNTSSQVFLLRKLIPHLKEPDKTQQIEKVLAETRAMQERSDREKQERAIELAELARYLDEPLRSEVIREAFATAQKIDKTYERNLALSISVSALKELSSQALGNSWSKILRVLSNRKREELLRDIEALAPAISLLGGAEGVEKTMQAIEDVGRWWS